MPLRTAGFCVFVLLFGCAPPPQAPVQRAKAGPDNVELSGTILAVHPVPLASVQRVQTLLSGAGPHDGPVSDNLSEFIVRTGNGSIIAVVQRQDADLQPGEQIRIQTGVSPRISVPVIH